jgi:hypothetical protein
MADELQQLMDGTTGHFWTKIGDVLKLAEAAGGAKFSKKFLGLAAGDAYEAVKRTVTAG